MATIPPSFISSRVFRLLWLSSLALLLCQNARATTVVPPGFDSLVQQADYVVRGTVTSVTSEWRDQNGNHNIVTLVGIDVIETIAGTPPSPLVLQMLGGKVGDKQMIVQGSPAFVVGGEYILFIRGNGVQFNPLVALMHGQYPVKKDASGRRYVTRSDGSLLHDEKEVSQPMEARHALASTPQTASAQSAATEAPALSASDFSTRIRASRQKPAPAHEK